MNEYIKREDAIQSIIAHDALKDVGDSRGYAEWLLNRAPSADVVPVRRGRWITKDGIIDCSVCNDAGWSVVPYEALVKHFNYCPNCGAKMKGAVDEVD